MDIGGRPWYALEKFEEAVYELAVRPGNACERTHLVKLIISGTTIDNIPANLREDYEWMFSKLGPNRPYPNRNTCGKIAERVIKIRDGLKTFLSEEVIDI